MSALKAGLKACKFVKACDLQASAVVSFLAQLRDKGKSIRTANYYLSDSDTEGRVIDFHALRHTFISMIVRSGATPKVAQELARHSTITLTMDRYAHVGLHDRTAAIDALPPLVPGQKSTPGIAATGTDGRPTAPNSLGPCLGPRQNVLVRFNETDPASMGMAPDVRKPRKKPGQMSNSQGGKGRVGDRARTGDILIHSQVL